ncbi:MAG: TetR/AcrR family transcriptional regulator [Brumimicrobium sp.]
MARKKDHSEKGIIDASVDLIAKYNKDSFSVRNVANHLNSSTQPIYSYFKDSNELYHKTLLEIEGRLINQINYPYTEFPFRNMGFGFTLFAKENPNLFDAYFNDLEMNKKFVDKFLKKLRKIMSADVRFVKMSEKGKDTLLETMWTFCYGYAFLIIKGVAKDILDEDIKEMVLETGTAIISHTFKKEGVV